MIHLIRLCRSQCPRFVSKLNFCWSSCFHLVTSSNWTNCFVSIMLFSFSSFELVAWKIIFWRQKLFHFMTAIYLCMFPVWWWFLDFDMYSYIWWVDHRKSFYISLAELLNTGEWLTHGIGVPTVVTLNLKLCLDWVVEVFGRKGKGGIWRNAFLLIVKSF